VHYFDAKKFLYKSLFAEVGQVIAGIKFTSFLTPDMASKNSPYFIAVISCLTSTFEPSTEGSFAEVWQVIAGTKFVRFLTPNMASKNNARHCIDYSVL